MTTSRTAPPKAAFTGLLALEAYTRTAVSRHDDHLVRLRASVLNGCRYCLAMHRRDARKGGWDPARIAATEDWPAHREAFDDGELAVLRLTDAVTRIDGEESVSDDLWGSVVDARGEKGAGQVLVAIVTINAWNRIAVTTRQDPTTLRGVTAADLAGLPG